MCAFPLCLGSDSPHLPLCRVPIGLMTSHTLVSLGSASGASGTAGRWHPTHAWSRNTSHLFDFKSPTCYTNHGNQRQDPQQTEQPKCDLLDRSANPIEKLGSSPAERVFMHRRVKGCPLWYVFPSPESQPLSRWRLQVPRAGEVTSLPAYQGWGGFHSAAEDNG